jgi:HK97 family phage portal protein
MPTLWQKIIEKLNPAQSNIAQDEGHTSPSNQTKMPTITKAYDSIEVVNRCINLLVDNAAMVDYDVAETLKFTGQYGTGIKKVTIDKLLNYRPNPYMDISTFRRLILLDFLLDGNAFIHFDGTSLYHIPADRMKIIVDEETYINSYVFDETVTFKANEIIFIKDNNTDSNYRGQSRVNSALNSLYNREAMLNFQKSFFDNGAAVGLIIETETVLSKKMKDRQEREWMAKYNPQNGASRPLILDAGLKAKSVANTNFRELNMNDSVSDLEDKVATALGVPPLLLDSGNNANIKPNLELMFYTTILPMLRKLESALEYYFAFDVELSTHRVPAMKPDQKAESDRLSALVNNGIITGNEAREILRFEPIKDPNMEKIRIPANIAGSATGVSGQEGGKPPQEEE